MPLVIKALTYTERFKTDFKKLDAASQKAVKACLEKLLSDPLPKSLRHHTLAIYRPKIHKIDVTSNHSHQITFEVDGDVAKLLRVGTHRQIDRDPRLLTITQN